MKYLTKNIIITCFALIAFLTILNAERPTGLTYPIVDTGQTIFYNNTNEITAPSTGSAFFGQDAQYSGNQPSYTDNGDGTITDNITGLMWTKSPDLNQDGLINVSDKLTQPDALSSADTLTAAGYSDWRLPTIKELYSLIVFSGLDCSGYDGGNPDDLVPFIDTDYFDFGYGDENSGERIIDAQFATSTIYSGTTMNGDQTMFGVNFADGRIKGYPVYIAHENQYKTFYVYYVRGNSDYGNNDFVNNNNGTITDNATGLMWQQNDSGAGMDWEDALQWAQTKNNENYLGYTDWRLPDAKELQSIVDYTRSPQTTASASIDTLFTCSAINDESNISNYPFYWTGTTHANFINGVYAAYVAFGEALGFMEMPPNSGNYQLLDVHGAGAQRSDPKSGNPDDYPYGHGPQGDVIRINNFVRLVRDAEVTNINDETGNIEYERDVYLKPNYPNPFNPETKITFSARNPVSAKIEIYNVIGQKVRTLVNESFSAGDHEVTWYGKTDSSISVSSGVYFVKLTTGRNVETRKIVLMK